MAARPRASAHAVAASEAVPSQVTTALISFFLIQMRPRRVCDDTGVRSLAHSAAVHAFTPACMLCELKGQGGEAAQGWWVMWSRTPERFFIRIHTTMSGGSVSIPPTRRDNVYKNGRRAVHPRPSCRHGTHGSLTFISTPQLLQRAGRFQRSPLFPARRACGAMMNIKHSRASTCRSGIVGVARHAHAGSPRHHHLAAPVEARRHPSI